MSVHEVAIVGAGVHGASAAFHLSKKGVEAVVLERGTPAGGPTGLSSGVCRAGYTNAFLARTAHESIGMLADFESLTGGGDSGLTITGMLYVHRPEDVAEIDRLVAALRGIGIDVSIIDRERLAAEHVHLEVEEGETAVWEASAGYADPAGTTRGLVDAAVRGGVTLHTGTDVVCIEPQEAGGAVLTTDGGDTVCARKVLLAAGPWTLPLIHQLGEELPLTVERHAVAMFAYGDTSPIPYAIGDVPRGYYLKPEGAGQFGLGSLLSQPQVDPDDFEREATADDVASLSEAATGRAPVLAGARPAGGWASLYDVSPDWQPVIGEIADGVFLVAGTSGHGFKLAPALGGHVAAQMLGESYDAGLDQFSPERFRAGVALPAGFGDARILG